MKQKYHPVIYSLQEDWKPEDSGNLLNLSGTHKLPGPLTEARTVETQVQKAALFPSSRISIRSHLTPLPQSPCLEMS